MGKILVAGFGFVGRAYSKWLRYIGNDVNVYAKPEDYPNMEKFGFVLPSKKEKYDAAVICLPTPTTDGYCDTSIVESVMADLNKNYKIAQFVIKSTVPIGTTRKMENALGKRVLFYPEFLEAKNPLGGVSNQKIIAFGSTKTFSEKERAKLLELFFGGADKPSAPAEFVSAETAESLKYIHNLWLATNISFWNAMVNNSQIKDTGVDTSKVLKLIHRSEYFGTHPWAVGKAYGGACLPKDIGAFIGSSKPEDGVFMDFLKMVDLVNDTVKGEKKDEKIQIITAKAVAGKKVINHFNIRKPMFQPFRGNVLMATQKKSENTIECLKLN